jgi:hypothetical protein
LCLLIVLLYGFGCSFLDDFSGLNASISDFLAIKVNYNSVSLLSGLVLYELSNPLNLVSAIDNSRVS